ncbi:condensation domain-containing protein, partial [Peribacillus simplex]|uniref:condensation domain-containing protein n=1 Tax=Peribacillus simplex TaxID=1478 RepID=UPI003D2E4B8A
PKPDLNDAITTQYKEATSGVEEILTRVWQEVLGMERIGVQDNFYELGGDSIKAVQIAARLKNYGKRLEVRYLFQHPTIEDVRGYVESTVLEVPQHEVKGESKLTPIQHWFFGNKLTNNHHWNQAMMVYRKDGFNQTYLETVLAKLVHHHDALRATFQEAEGEMGQRVSLPNEQTYSLLEYELYQESAVDQAVEAICNELQRSIDIENGPLLKACLFRTAEGDHLALIVHHLVIDGVSWRILLEDLIEGYRQAEEGEIIQLPLKTHSYQEWGEGLASYAQQTAVLRQAGYWNSVEQRPMVYFPKDVEVGNGTWRDGKTKSIHLSEEETRKLLTEVHKAYRTEINDILLTTLGRAVKKWTGQEQLAIQMEGHGREEILKGIDISRTVGWFTTEFPFFIDVSGEDLSYHIKKVKEDLRKIPDKGIGYGILKYLTPKEKHSIPFKLKPEVSFNYLGEMDGGLKEEGIQGSFLSAGDQISPESERLYPIDVTGMTIKDKLYLNINYDSTRFKETSIEKLLVILLEELLLIIEHCLLKEEVDLTPSDLGDNELTFDELEDISSILSEI